MIKTIKIFAVITIYLMLAFTSNSQIIEFDLGKEFTLNAESSKLALGAKLNLGTPNNSVFLRLSSYDLEKDHEFPVISWTSEYPLLFGHENEGVQERLRIGIDGQITVPDLATGAKQNIMVDPSGQLIVDTVGEGYAGIVTLLNYDFVSKDNPEDHNWKNSGTYHEEVFSIPASSESLVAPIHLPHQSSIHKVTVHYFDNNPDGGGDVEFQIVSQLHTPGASILTLGQTSGSSSSNQSLTWEASGPMLPVDIDNIKRRYTCEVIPMTTNSWPGEEVRINAVVIYYKLL